LQTRRAGQERFEDAGKCGDEVLTTAREKEEEAWEQLRQAVSEKAAVDEPHAQSKRHVVLAEQEPASTRRMQRQCCLSRGEQDDEETKGSANTCAPHGRFHISVNQHAT